MLKGQIGIELGTKHIRIYAKDKEIRKQMKNALALDQEAKLVAMGNEAYGMYEKEPSKIQIVMPMTHGVIGDYTNLRLLLHNVFGMIFRRFRKYQCFVAVPADISNVEKRAFYDLIWESENRIQDIYLIPKPLADGIGAGLKVEEPRGNMIVNLGADTTEISVISLGGIVASKCFKYGGNQLEEVLMYHIKQEKNLAIGRKSAERLKILYSRSEEEKEVVLKGRDLVTGLPCKTTVSTSVVEPIVRRYVSQVGTKCKTLLEMTPPELASDIMMEGAYLTGGSSCFSMLKNWLEDDLQLNIHTVSHPEETVIQGLTRMIENRKNEYK